MCQEEGGEARVMRDNLERERGSRWASTAENTKALPEVVGEDGRGGGWAESWAPSVWGGGSWTGGRKTRSMGSWKQGESASRRREGVGCLKPWIGPLDRGNLIPEWFGWHELEGGQKPDQRGSQE